ncbi:MAG TPA: hypothetical protein VGR16_13260 [Thermomicrobiales bacterium]|nr:hypothetical protein [Thermomicrobiales bacterium]
MTDSTTTRASAQTRQDQATGDRLEILRMVESGVITAEEAATLLETLDRADRMMPGTGRDFRSSDSEARRGGVVRIRITEGGSSKPTVNIALPLKLIDTGLSIAEQFVPQYLDDAGALREAVLSGMRGSILDIQDEDEHVEIFVE